jgi:hypothetical protein
MDLLPPAIRATSAVVETGRFPGSSRGSSICVSARGGGGGDEETRTPDPLLAKEMLYQLSYVPLAGRVNGGRFWTRTRDLCLIRAVL